MPSNYKCTIDIGLLLVHIRSLLVTRYYWVTGSSTVIVGVGIFVLNKLSAPDVSMQYAYQSYYLVRKLINGHPNLCILHIRMHTCIYYTHHAHNACCVYTICMHMYIFECIHMHIYYTYIQAVHIYIHVTNTWSPAIFEYIRIAFGNHRPKMLSTSRRR